MYEQPPSVGPTGSRVPSWLERRLTAALAATILLGTGVRFAGLDLQSFYLDETVTAWLTEMSFGGMLDELPGSESAPPLYYVLLWFWAELWGTGEVALRSLSAVFGVLTIPVAYLAARRLVGPRVGLTVALLVALNPLLVWYSQEARVYALFVLFVALGLLAMIEVLRNPSRRSLAWWVAASAATMLTHYFAAFLILPEAILLLIVGVRRRDLLVAGAVLAAVQLALAPLALAQGDGGIDWITENPLIERVGDTAAQFLFGPGAPAPALVGPLALALVAAGLWLLLSRVDTGERRAAVRIIAIATVGIALPLLLAVGGPDIFIQKSLIGALVPLLIALGIAYAGTGAGRIGLGLTVALSVLWLVVLAAVATTPTLQRDDWRGAAEALGSSPDERLVLVNPADAGDPHQQAIEYYIPGAESAPLQTPVTEIDLLSLNDNGLDAQVRGVPPLPEFSPPPRFELVDRTETDRFVLLRYRSPEAEAVPRWAERTSAELSAADRGVTQPLLIPPGASIG